MNVEAHLASLYEQIATLTREKSIATGDLICAHREIERHKATIGHLDAEVAKLREENDETLRALDELLAQVRVGSAVTDWSDTLNNVMRRRYARECEQWKANHEQRKMERDEARARLASAQDAARSLVALVDDLGAFADDNDPRAMAVAGPIGRAQADLWIALGMSTTDEAASMQADIVNRCAVCGWTLAESADRGCVRGNCSMRPRPTILYAPERADKERTALAAESAPTCGVRVVPGFKFPGPHFVCELPRGHDGEHRGEMVDEQDTPRERQEKERG